MPLLRFDTGLPPIVNEKVGDSLITTDVLAVAEQAFTPVTVTVYCLLYTSDAADE